MARCKLVAEGNAQIRNEGPEPGTLVLFFKQEGTACKAKMKDISEGKGVVNNRLAEC